MWDGPTPGARCEVFISQIPRDTYEDQLIPLFSSVGPLWEFRLMMNFSGQNRGFAYGKYGSPAVATEAIRVLHGHVLEPGLSLSVRRSTEKRHLCIGDLPASTRQEDLLQVQQLTETLCIYLYNNLFKILYHLIITIFSASFCGLASQEIVYLCSHCTANFEGLVTVIT